MKNEKIKFDKQTKKWFAKNFSGQTTIMKCEKCGLFLSLVWDISVKEK